MLSIVELREISDEKLAEMLENSREEIFNLRFQQASAQLDDLSQIKRVRREIAQLETVLNQRALAVKAALMDADVAKAVEDEESWTAKARFNYENSTWDVKFFGQKDVELVATQVNLNKKKAHGRKARKALA